MSTLLETFVPDFLTPAQYPGDARLDAVAFGANLTVLKGTAIAIKTSDGKAYALNSGTGTNEVQTLNFANSPAGTFNLRIVDSAGVEQLTGPITYSGTAATLVSNIQTAINVVIPQVSATSQIVVSGSAVTAIALTFSGTGAGYAGVAQPFVRVDANGLTAGTVALTRTTAGGITDGTQLFKAFNKYSLQTDANGKIYYVTGGTASGSYRTPPLSTSPVYTSGIFDPQDLQTKQTPVAEVDTFTATNPTTGDVYKLTITYPDQTTYSVSATVGATQTATAIDALLIAAWNADATASLYAVASGTTTLALTSAIPGNVMNIAGTVTGTGTIAKVVTTSTSGRAIGDIIAGNPGAFVLPNGFWKI